MVKTLSDDHKCLHKRIVKACIFKFLAKNIIQKLQGNPIIIPLRALQVELSKTFEFVMSK